MDETHDHESILIDSEQDYNVKNGNKPARWERHEVLETDRSCSDTDDDLSLFGIFTPAMILKTSEHWVGFS